MSEGAASVLRLWARGQDLIALALAWWGEPSVQAVAGPILYLSSINGIFWLLARVAAAFVSVFEEALWEEVANLIAVIYTFALAALFAAMIFLSAAPGHGAARLFWREACGFVLLYVALGAALTDRSSGQIIPYSFPGYVAGLVAYLVFAAFPSALDFEWVIGFHGLLEVLARSLLGRVLSALTVVEIVRGVVGRGFGWVLLIVSPVLWRVGLQRYPMIRLRRRKD